jgi:hypothetical protein
MISEQDVTDSSTAECRDESDRQNPDQIKSASACVHQAGIRENEDRRCLDNVE